MNKPRILVVDDEPDLRECMCDVLSMAGYETESAENGVSAIEKISGNVPDLIITDIIMPEKEGIEMIIKLKSDYKDKIKIIAMSGGGKIPPEDYLCTAELLGVDKTLKKPFNVEELLNTVQSIF